MSRKIAIIGVGKIAMDQHVPRIAQSPDWELAAIVSRSNQIAGIESFKNIDELINTRPDIDVVSICTPPQPRFEIASKALYAGKHVMLEKPPGASIAEVYSLEKLAKSNGLTLYTTWHSRKAASVEFSRKWLTDKPLLAVHIKWHESVRQWHPHQETIWEPGGLGVFDPGINALSILTEIIKEPIHIIKSDLWVPENKQTPIAALLEFHHPHNAKITADFDWRIEGEAIWEITAVTSMETLKLTHGGGRVFINNVEQFPSSDLKKNEHPLAYEYRKLYEDMSRLVEHGICDVDLSPAVHVADAFALGHKFSLPSFYE